VKRNRSNKGEVTNVSTITLPVGSTSVVSSMNAAPAFKDVSPAPTLSRRQFLATSAAGIAGLGFSRMVDVSIAAGVNDQCTRRPGRRAFSFLHTYESTGRYWQGLEKAGLVRNTSGIRLVNSPWGGDEHRFNHVARLGGPLHQILCRLKCPFVIDRVAGGSPYRPYPFDGELARAYAELLGNDFLGGQVHEPISNTHNDWKRFVEANSKFKHEAIRPEDLRSYFNSANERRWLEYGALEDYAGRVHPPDETAFWPEVQWNIQRNASRFGSHFSCAEGSHWGQLAWHMFYKWGAISCFAEVGPWASEDSQFGIASLRGAAKAAGRPWGVFFAPWGPKGCTSFLPAEDWTWRCPPEEMNASAWPVGPTLGPSTALQRRIFFHAYLSGAHTLHEEWGAEGNLESWTDAKLSSYGHVTKDLLDFQEAHPDVGQPFTPLALVLDTNAYPPGSGPWDQLKLGLRKESTTKAGDAMQNGEAEARCYPSWVIPELFDIVPSDAPEDIWGGYQCILAFDKFSAPKTARIVEPNAFTEAVIHAAQDLSPIDCTAHLPIQINHRLSDGAWIVALYNHWGAERGDVSGTGSILDPGCVQREVLRPKFSFTTVKAIYAWPEASGVAVRQNGLEVTVGPGGTLVLEIQVK
jgi:hypothetical protein